MTADDYLFIQIDRPDRCWQQECARSGPWDLKQIIAKTKGRSTQTSPGSFYITLILTACFQTIVFLFTFLN